MPKCHNHSKAFYKGTEPSPKGLGYCARGSQVGAKMLGKNGKLWIVRQNKNGVKQWKRTMPHETNQPALLKPQTFRMVIGYFREQKKYSDNYDPNDNRPFATKQTLAKFAKSKAMWDQFIDDIPVTNGKGQTYNVKLAKLTPKFIKRIKVLNAPVHTPTFWEKLVGTSWYQKPDLVLVVDFHHVPLVSNDKGWGNDGFTNFDSKFYYYLLSTVNHHMWSAEGWINHVDYRKPEKQQKEDGPFKGDLMLLQMGQHTKQSPFLPNYRKFTMGAY